MLSFTELVTIHKQAKQEILHGYTTHLTTQEIGELIDAKLHGNDIKRQNILTLAKKFQAQYTFTKNIQYLEIYKNIQFIFLYRNAQQTFFDCKKEFKELYTLSLYAITSDHNLYLDPPPSEEINSIINSIIFFRKKNINLKLHNGEINLENFSYLIERKIDGLLDKLGHWSIEFLLLSLKKHTKSIFYCFPDSSNKILLPIGYIFNKAIKHIKPSKLNHQQSIKNYQTLLLYSSHYICLHKLQNYNNSQFQYIYSDINSMIKLINKQVISDQIFKIEQYDPESIFYFIKFIQEKYEDVRFSIIKDIAQHLLEQPKNIPYLANDLFSSLEKRLDKDIYLDIYNLLVNENPNIKFNNIDDLEFIDYKLKPFIKNKFGSLSFINHNFFFVGFYHVLLELLYQNGIDSKKQGFLIEFFAEEQLKSSTTSFITGEKVYKLNKNQRNILGIKSEQLESDMIIYNDEKIGFFEFKLRTLVKESKAGNSYYILNDLSESLLKSQTQLNKHKRYLQEFNSINFNSGQKLQFKSQEIYKISVSSLDYQGLHNPTIFHTFLQQIPNYTLAPNEDLKIAKLVKNINENFSVYTKEIMSEKTKFEILEPNGMMNNFYINVFHLLFLINQSKINNRNLLDELASTKNIRLNQFDFYYNYHFINDLRKN
jgi:hypothetical protein